MPDLSVSATFDLLGIEDLARGQGTFTRSTNTGGTQTITKVNAESLGIYTPRSVKEYGAVGDGTTDDTDAIQACIDDAQSENPGTVYFPEGRYKITSAINIQSGSVHLLGEGRDVATIISSASTDLIDYEVVFDVTKAISVRGLGFENMGMVIKLRNVPTSTVLDYVDVQNCKFTECGAAVYWNDFTVGSGIERCTIIDNVVEDCDRGFYIGCRIIRQSEVAFNTIKDCVRKGIQLGVNVTDLDTDTDEPDMSHHRVIGNYINGVSDPDGIDGVYVSNAIYVYGQYAVISGNIIQNVTTGNQDDSEGIYVKCRNSTITHNVLIDAGTGQGCISHKGSVYDGGDAYPRGYGVVIANNAIYSTGLAPDATLYYGTGIHTQTGNCLIADNYIEGLHGHGVRVETNSVVLTEKANNVTIRGNVIKKSRGSYAISVAAVSDKVTIEDNTIDEILDEDASTGYAAGIYLLPYAGSAGITRVRIRRNIIRDVADTLELGRGIWMVRLTDAVLDDVIVEDNEIDGVEAFGVALSGELPITGLVIRNNKIKNITTADGDIARTGTADYSAAGAIIEGNYGDFVNENRGQATLVSGTTSIAVTHGLSNVSGIGGTPLAQDIIVTPMETLGSASFFWVSSIGATTFTINTNANPAADVDFAWQVRRRTWQT